MAKSHSLCLFICTVLALVSYEVIGGAQEPNPPGPVLLRTNHPHGDRIDISWQANKAKSGNVVIYGEFTTRDGGVYYNLRVPPGKPLTASLRIFKKDGTFLLDALDVKAGSQFGTGTDDWITLTPNQVVSFERSVFLGDFIRGQPLPSGPYYIQLVYTEELFAKPGEQKLPGKPRTASPAKPVLWSNILRIEI